MPTGFGVHFDKSVKVARKLTPTNLTKVSKWRNCCGAEFDKTVKYHFLYGNKNNHEIFFLFITFINIKLEWA